jgi:two-component system, cell cycle sensor histidine kinase and response regulator CckA
VRNLRASLERALATSRPDRMPIQKYDIRRPESAGGGFEPHWWSPLNLPVLGPDGTVQHIIHWVEDVTELVELKREVEHEHAVLEDQIRTSAQRIVAETTLRDEALEATRRLGESARRYRFLANAVPELIWTADPTGRVTYGNARWAEVTALRAEEVEGDGWQAALHPDDRASTVAAWTAAVRAGADRFQIEHRIRAGEAGYRWMLTTARPYRDDQGNTTMWLGSTTDIHDRVVAEDQARQTHRLQAVGKLAGGMAHEVNNMMSIVIGLGDLVRRSLGPGHSAASDIDEIVKAGARAAAVTRQLLAFSRQQVLTPTVIDIGAIVRELAPALERVLGADRRLEIVAGTLSWRVVADRMQMEQVLVNLVGQRA